MRINARYGWDTGMALVDVDLESDRECGLSYREVWAEVRPLLAAQGIPVGAVLDLFLRRRGPGGEWVSVELPPWDAQ